MGFFFDPDDFKALWEKMMRDYMKAGRRNITKPDKRNKPLKNMEVIPFKDKGKILIVADVKSGMNENNTVVEITKRPKFQTEAKRIQSKRGITIRSSMLENDIFYPTDYVQDINFCINNGVIEIDLEMKTEALQEKT